VGGVRTLLPFRNRPGPRRQHAPRPPAAGGRLDLPDTAPTPFAPAFRQEIAGSGRPPAAVLLAKGVGILKVAKSLGIGTGTVQRISNELG